VNVAALAARFGGGGHARAAGAKIDAPLDQVVRQVSEALVEAVR
jgi:phosphoesterase RecJ-like protein